MYLATSRKPTIRSRTSGSPSLGFFGSPSPRGWPGRRGPGTLGSTSFTDALVLPRRETRFAAQARSLEAPQLHRRIGADRRDLRGPAVVVQGDEREVGRGR